MSETIEIINASTHNLKNISLSIPKNKLVLITGVSGSGKSSLAFDTLYAEGQKRYLESLSSYARMIVSNISDDIRVEDITGLSPTIAINQKTVSNNPRSIVGTITEIYNYYRLLYNSIGKPHCPNHPHVHLQKDTAQSVIDTILEAPIGQKFHILIGIGDDRQKSVEGMSTIDRSRNIVGSELIRVVSEMGFVRVEIGGISLSLGDINTDGSYPIDTIFVIVDRLIQKSPGDPSYEGRLRDSISLGFEKGDGKITIRFLDSDTRVSFSQKATCEVCGYRMESLTLSHFSFNSHYGACQHCHGLGVINSFSESSVINPRLSLSEGAILQWTQHPYYTTLLEAVCQLHSIDISIPYQELPRAQKEKILYGIPETVMISHVSSVESKGTHKAKYEGVIRNLERRFNESEGDRMDTYFLKRIATYVEETPCPECHGHRLNEVARSVRIGGKNIGELCELSVRESLDFFSHLILSENEKKITELVFKNIIDRLEFLDGVGLSYVTLGRQAGTLSGGESQRIRLATQIGTKLEGIIYVLDEPSIGLHPRDNVRLIQNLRKLVSLGNTVIVVEHDEDIMRECDYIIDIGPRAGVHGGEIVFQGTYEQISMDNCTVENKNGQISMDNGSNTGDYLTGRKRITRKNPIKKLSSKTITITGARENNLKNITISIPLGCMTVVTGVSGSGKSSLIIDILSNAALNHFNTSRLPVGKHETVSGLEELDKTIIIDQSPIGKTPHSNIATYTGVFTHIREVFAASLEAQKRGYGPGRFSFNTKGGRCEVCEGSGTKKIEMHFLPDVHVECDACHGTRYNRETLGVLFKGKNISDVLRMTVEEAAVFFVAFPRISRVLEVLLDVGLGYIELGQSATTLSGGEAQRIKLAFDLSKRSTGKTLYILDEPTTGLHFSDVQKLIDILDRLVEKGNTIIIIEHHLDIIALSDFLIDIGPEGGSGGGQLLFSGVPHELLSCHTSYTAEALRQSGKMSHIKK